MDLRIEKTYRALLAAFSELLEERRYEDITVAMLCERADIRRTTFYKHFADKAAFFAFYIDSMKMDLRRQGAELLESERALTHVSGEAALREATRAVLRQLVEFLDGHETLVNNVLGGSIGGVLQKSFMDKTAEALRERYEQIDIDWERRGISLADASEFAAGGIVRMFNQWWASGHAKADKPQLIDATSEMACRIMLG